MRRQRFSFFDWAVFGMSSVPKADWNCRQAYRIDSLTSASRIPKNSVNQSDGQFGSVLAMDDAYVRNYLRDSHRFAIICPIRPRSEERTPFVQSLPGLRRYSKHLHPGPYGLDITICGRVVKLDDGREVDLG